MRVLEKCFAGDSSEKIPGYSSIQQDACVSDTEVLLLNLLRQKRVSVQSDNSEIVIDSSEIEIDNRSPPPDTCVSDTEILLLDILHKKSVLVHSDSSDIDVEIISSISIKSYEKDIEIWRANADCVTSDVEIIDVETISNKDSDSDCEFKGFVKSELSLDVEIINKLIRESEKKSVKKPTLVPRKNSRKICRGDYCGTCGRIFFMQRKNKRRWMYCEKCRDWICSNCRRIKCRFD